MIEIIVWVAMFVVVDISQGPVTVTAPEPFETKAACEAKQEAARPMIADHPDALAYGMTCAEVKIKTTKQGEAALKGEQRKVEPTKPSGAPKVDMQVLDLKDQA